MAECPSDDEEPSYRQNLQPLPTDNNIYLFLHCPAFNELTRDQLFTTLSILEPQATVSTINQPFSTFLFLSYPNTQLAEQRRDSLLRLLFNNIPTACRFQMDPPHYRPRTTNLLPASAWSFTIPPLWWNTFVPPLPSPTTDYTAENRYLTITLEDVPHQDITYPPRQEQHREDYHHQDDDYQHCYFDYEQHIAPLYDLVYDLKTQINRRDVTINGVNQDFTTSLSTITTDIDSIQSNMRHILAVLHMTPTIFSTATIPITEATEGRPTPFIYRGGFLADNILQLLSELTHQPTPTLMISHKALLLYVPIFMDSIPNLKAADIIDVFSKMKNPFLAYTTLSQISAANISHTLVAVIRSIQRDYLHDDYIYQPTDLFPWVPPTKVTNPAPPKGTPQPNHIIINAYSYWQTLPNIYLLEVPLPQLATKLPLTKKWPSETRLHYVLRQLSLLLIRITPTPFKLPSTIYLCKSELYYTIAKALHLKPTEVPTGLPVVEHYTTLHHFELVLQQIAKLAVQHKANQWLLYQHVTWTTELKKSPHDMAALALTDYCYDTIPIIMEALLTLLSSNQTDYFEAVLQGHWALDPQDAIYSCFPDPSQEWDYARLPFYIPRLTELPQFSTSPTEAGHICLFTTYNLIFRGLAILFNKAPKALVANLHYKDTILQNCAYLHNTSQNWPSNYYLHLPDSLLSSDLLSKKRDFFQQNTTPAMAKLPTWQYHRPPYRGLDPAPPAIPLPHAGPTTPLADKENPNPDPPPQRDH